MNKTKYFLLSLLAVLSLAACSTDGDLITAGGVPAVELSSSGDVVLDRNNTSGLALTPMPGPRLCNIRPKASMPLPGGWTWPETQPRRCTYG